MNAAIVLASSLLVIPASPVASFQFKSLRIRRNAMPQASNQPPSDRRSEPRQRLADRIGYLLAQHWLRRQGESSRSKRSEGEQGTHRGER